MKYLALVLLLAATPARADDIASVADLAWMSGSWAQERPDGAVRETWMPPYEGAMAGVTQTHRPGKTVATEFATITTGPAGVTFTAYLKGQAPTAFLLRPGPPGEAVFENPGHDFPQRVIYQRCDADLCARIEGLVDGKLKGMAWRYRRLP